MRDISSGVLARHRKWDWQDWVRLVYTVLFVLNVLLGVAAFALFYSAWQDASSTQTALTSSPIFEHGEMRWVAPGQGFVVDLLRSVWMAGTFVLIPTGFLLQFVFRIPVFPDQALRPKWRRR